jgi:acyl dehydratase
MPLDLSLVGKPAEPIHHSWTEDDVMLYALAVGAGAEDPTHDLALTTENASDAELAVLPTFVNILAGQATPHLGDVDRTAVLHAEQSFTLNRPLPASGSTWSTTTVTAMYDKGSAALAMFESEVVDEATGDLLAVVSSTLFLRGEGGFGGERGPSDPTTLPDRAADLRVEAATRPEQALLYRLTGDRNPLHSDPAQAARAGFAQPILHGMCTYGFAGRILLQAVCGGDVRRFQGMSGRFSSPVLPGEPLTVEIWLPTTNPGQSQSVTAAFRATSGDRTVLDRGRITYTH